LANLKGRNNKIELGIEWRIMFCLERIMFEDVGCVLLVQDIV
jgi:hypothetical protein